MKPPRRQPLCGGGGRRRLGARGPRTRTRPHPRLSFPFAVCRPGFKCATLVKCGRFRCWAQRPICWAALGIPAPRKRPDARKVRTTATGRAAGSDRCWRPRGGAGTLRRAGGSVGGRPQWTRPGGSRVRPRVSSDLAVPPQVSTPPRGTRTCTPLNTCAGYSSITQKSQKVGTAQRPATGKGARCGPSVHWSVCHSATERRKVPALATTWMDLEHTPLGKGRQTQATRGDSISVKCPEQAGPRRQEAG